MKIEPSERREKSETTKNCVFSLTLKSRKITSKCVLLTTAASAGTVYRAAGFSVVAFMYVSQKQGYAQEDETTYGVRSVLVLEYSQQEVFFFT